GPLGLPGNDVTPELVHERLRPGPGPVPYGNLCPRPEQRPEDCPGGAPRAQQQRLRSGGTPGERIDQTGCVGVLRKYPARVERKCVGGADRLRRRGCFVSRSEG